MSNQASEDTLNLRAWLKGNGWLWHESHVVTPDCLDEMQDAIQSLIRTEKLKLLAEVREEAFSGDLSFELDDSQIVIEVETDLESIITKLEAEL